VKRKKMRKAGCFGKKKREKKSWKKPAVLGCNQIQREKFTNDKLNETATFENVEIFVKQLEVSKFSDDDKDFVADLSKCIKIKN